MTPVIMESTGKVSASSRLATVEDREEYLQHGRGRERAHCGLRLVRGVGGQGGVPAAREGEGEGPLWSKTCKGCGGTC